MIGKEYFLASLEAICQVIIEHEEELNRLDNAIGDGDHGTNMASFARIILKELPEVASTHDDFGEILHHVGMRSLCKIGGSAGPLFGKFFLHAGMVLKGSTSIEPTDFAAAFEDGAMGVAQIGYSTEGEKTMLDALFPAIRAMEEALEEGWNFQEMLQAGVEAAQGGVEYTKTIPASKGRASYIGQRSIGHQDPGATTIMLMLQALHRTAVAQNLECS